MGGGNFNLRSYRKQAEKAAVKKNAGFEARAMCEEFNPALVTTRYSKQGPFNLFRDVITVLVGLDVTGSMGVIPKSLLKGGLGTLMLDLQAEFDRPDENIQLSFAGLGDAKSDRAPLQVTHFESDNRFALQLPKIWLEGGGGANGGESYNLLWYYASQKTELDYVERIGRKGILVTVGDDNCHRGLTASEIQMWLDPSYKGEDLTNETLVAAASEQYELYHIIVTDGHAHTYDYPRQERKSQTQINKEINRWKTLLGEDRVILAQTHEVAEAIADAVKRHRPVHEDALPHDMTQEEWADYQINNLSDEQWRSVLEYTLCPLSHEFMTNPVVIGDGKRAYEKTAVHAYMRDNGRDPVSFLSGKHHLDIKKNINIAQLCNQYRPYYDTLPNDRKSMIKAGFEVIPPVQLLALPVSSVSAASASALASETIFAAMQASGSASSSAAPAPSNLLEMLECPITQLVMVDPVLLGNTGHTFERSAIQDWLRGHNTDPLTGVELGVNNHLVSNFSLKAMCDAHHAQASSGAQP